MSAPDISDHTGRRVSDWTGENAEVEMIVSNDLPDNSDQLMIGHHRAEAKSQINVAEPDESCDSEGDSLMNGKVNKDSEQHEVQS